MILYPTWIDKCTKLKHATKLLGFQDAKHTKEHENVLENVSREFSLFGKLRKLDIQVACMEITTVVVIPSMSRSQILIVISNCSMFQK